MMRRRWPQFRALPRLDKRLLLQAWCFLPASKVGLVVLGFPTWKRLLVRFTANPVLHSGDLSPTGKIATAERVFRLVRTAERYTFVRPTCLERATVLWSLLRRRGVGSELRIGARKHEDRFEAHAWVECEGIALDSTDEIHRDYARFDAPIAAAEKDRP